MMTDPAALPSAPFPLHQCTSGELDRYRAELEHQIEGVSPDAPAATGLRRLMADLVAELDDRKRLRRVPL